jgi:hypothetical protein
MAAVRDLIERLDVSGTLEHFVQTTEQFGDDLERTWEESDNGAGLLWLAAALDVDHHRLVAAACDLLESVVEQVETVSSETIWVLETVRAWQRGEKSADEVNLCGADALALVEEPDQISLDEPWMDDVNEAASWLTELVEASAIVLDECAWEFADHLAHALALYGGWGSISDEPPDRYQHAYDEAARRFAPTIRRQITSAQVQTAARQSGIWPL